MFVKIFAYIYMILACISFSHENISKAFSEQKKNLYLRQNVFRDPLRYSAKSASLVTYCFPALRGIRITRYPLKRLEKMDFCSRGSTHCIATTVCTPKNKAAALSPRGIAELSLSLFPNPYDQGRVLQKIYEHIIHEGLSRAFQMEFLKSFSGKRERYLSLQIYSRRKYVRGVLVQGIFTCARVVNMERTKQNRGLRTSKQALRFTGPKACLQTYCFGIHRDGHVAAHTVRASPDNCSIACPQPTTTQNTC